MNEILQRDERVQASPSDHLNSDCQLQGAPSLLPTADCPLPTEKKWHVLWTRSNSEQLVNDQLAARGFEVFLPMIGIWKRRSGTRQRATVPMFPGYVFIHHAMDKQSFVAVSEARGIVRILGDGWDRLASVSGEEMDMIRRVESAPFPVRHHPYLRHGQRVRITGGLLANIEGIFLQEKPNKGLFVIAIDLLQRSVAVEIDESLVEPVL